MPKIDGKGAEIEKEVEVAKEDEVEVRLGRDWSGDSAGVSGRNKGYAEV